MRNRQLKSLFGIVAAFVLTIGMLGLPRGLQAQSSLGSITGTVTDPSGAVIPDATVKVTFLATNTTVVTKTTSSGLYIAPSLEPGEYTVTVDKSGFETGSVTSVAVFVGRETTANVSLQVGSTSVNVTVEAKATMITPNTAENTTTVENSLFHDLPFYEEDVMYALEAVAGFTGGTGSGVGGETPGVATGYNIPAVDIMAGGGRMGTHSFLVDGSDNTLPAYAREGMVFSAGDTQEISLVEGGMPAQYGRTGGALVNIATKGGSNQFHGELSWRHVDPFTEAYSFDATIPPLYHGNFFGVYVGGPIYLPKIYNGKNKTWFYFDYEPFRESNLSPGEIRTYTPGELTGDFSNAYSIINTSILDAAPPAGETNYQAALAAARTGSFWYQFPLNSAGFPTGLRYASASQYVQIPSGGPNNTPFYLGAQLAANPLAKYITSQFPTPQNPSSPFISFLNPQGYWDITGNNAWSYRGVLDKDNRWGLRIDHNFGNSDHLFVRYGSEYVNGQREGFFSNNLPLTAVPWDYTTTRNVSLNEVHTFSPSVVNEFRAVYLHVNVLREPNATELSKDWGPTVGLFSAVTQKGFPGIGWGDNNLGIATNGTLADLDQNFGVGDDLTWTHGRHIFRFGAETRRLQMNFFNESNWYGDGYNFSSGNTNNGSGGEAMASFDLGILSSLSAVPKPVPEYYRWHYWAGYAQDDIKLTKKLTAQVGMRYEFETPRVEKYNHQGTFEPNLTGTLNGQAVTGGFCFSGSCGLGSELWPANYRGFEPRLGLAYALTSKWVWHASYDLMRAPLTGTQGYNNIPDFDVSGSPIGGQYGGTNPNAYVNMITNPPVQPSGGYPVLSGGPYFTMYQGVSVSVPLVPQTAAVPYVQTWQLDTQYQLTRSDMIDIAYVGNHGAHLFGLFGNGQFAVPYNVPNESKLVSLGQAGTNFTTANLPNTLGIQTLLGATVSESVYQFQEPYQGFFYDAVDEAFMRDYDSDYNGLLMTWSHRTSHGLYLQTSFTWDKMIDDSPEVNGSASGEGGGANYNGGPFQNPYNLHGERAESINDQPWHLGIQYNYQLPIGTGKALALHNWVLNDVIGNWVWSGNYLLRSGIPMAIGTESTGYFNAISPTVNSSGNYTSYGTYLPTGYSIRPNVLTGVPRFTSNWRQDPTHLAFLNPAAFAMPGSLNNPQFGTTSRSFCCSPAMYFFDMAMQKRINIGKNETRYFSIEADAKNIFNHPTFYFNPNSGHALFSGLNVNSITQTAVPPFTLTSGFGVLQTDSSSRQVQLGLRFVW